MDQRRFAIWILATTLCLLLYLQLNPPPPAQNELEDPAKEKVAQLDQETKEVAPLRLEEQQRFSVGSMNPEDGYNLLVTFSNLGGAIERIELTERKPDGNLRYRRTDTESGYLGYLAPHIPLDIAGSEVYVVGAGTPAALATSAQTNEPGLRAGDVIVGFNGSAIDTPLTLDRLLEKTRPGDSVELEVMRPDPKSTDAAAENQAPSVEAEATKESESDTTQIAALPQVKRTAMTFTTKLTEHPLDLVRWSSSGGEDEISANQDRLSCLMTLARVGKRSILVGKQELTGLPSQYDSVWQSKVNITDNKAPASEIEFRLPLKSSGDAAGSSLELVRRYQLRKADDGSTDGYAIDLETLCENHGDQPEEIAFRLNGPNGITLEGWWYMTKISPNWWDAAGARDVVYSSEAAGHNLRSVEKIRKHAVDNPNDPELSIVSENESPEAQSLRYLAVDGQYFSAGFLPHEDEGSMLKVNRASAYLLADPKYNEKSKYRAMNVSFLVDTPVITAPANGTSTPHRVRLFAGPKRPELLSKVNMDYLIEYGFFPWVAIPLSKILHGFHWLFGNYGLAIVLLTVVVRGLMFPLGRRAAIHAQKMQEIAPELKKLNEKYKDDLQKRMEAQRELQRRVGFNPLSGCLPLFIQIPIFIGLYRCLSVDIELRQEPLIQGMAWCSNLAAPDQIAQWQSWLPDFIAGRGSGWLGPYFNLLPVIVVALFLIQQKLFMPPATDEQTLMTQKIMNFMTVFMGVFFFKVPAGLCIYFITSSLWSIAERKLVKKTIPAPGTNVKPSGGRGEVIDAAKPSAEAIKIEETKKRRRRLNK